MNIEPPFPPAADHYLRVWNIVLSRWLSWSPSRIDSFIARWADDMRNENDLFYHKLPLWHVVPVLVSPDIRQRYSPTQIDQIWSELEEAIMNHDCDYWKESFDWHEARRRAEAVLVRYGGSIAQTNDLAWYEEQKA